MGDAVRYEVADRVATITLDRPEARNALNTEVLRLLPRFILEAEADDAVDVIILTGADPAFCAGVDLKEAAAGGQARSRPTPSPSSAPSTASRSRAAWRWPSAVTS